MKRLLLLGLIGLFLSGCGTAAKDSEFWQHPSVYKSWGHMKYSMSEVCTPEMTKKSVDEGWWGIRNNECPK